MRAPDRGRGSFTLRAMCGNAVGMLAFVLAFLVSGDLAISIAIALLLGGLGYVGAGIVVRRYDL